MKLFAKYNRVNLLATLAIFIFSGLVFYFFIRLVLTGDVDDDLLVEKKEIETHVRRNNQLPEIISLNEQRTSYEKITQPYGHTWFHNVKAYDSNLHKQTNFREILFGLRVNNEEYKVSVIKSLEASHDLLRSILLIIIPVILLILAVSYLINRILVKRLWKPFYSTVDQLKSFSLHKKHPIQFQATGVEEFELLNNTLMTTTGKARRDYLTLKEFTENASHEMQTPLAIIGSKLDLLIQHENLSEEQSIAVQAAYDSVQKLNHLHQSLLLLARIGNLQFNESDDILLKDKINEKISAFQELWQHEQIETQSKMDDSIIRMNSVLLDILLNNLLANATHHNIKKGRIQIQVEKNSLSIKNTGEQIPLDTQKLFTRFYVAKKDKRGTGLGLSIVKQICDVSGFSVKYSFENNLHVFLLQWN